MVELSAVFMLVTLVVFALHGVLAAGVRQHVIARPRVLHWMGRTFAAAFVMLVFVSPSRIAKPSRGEQTGTPRKAP
jgi:hypothetical protein